MKSFSNLITGAVLTAVAILLMSVNVFGISGTVTLSGAADGQNFRLRWNRISGARGYEVHVQGQQTKVIYGESQTSYLLTQTSGAPEVNVMAFDSDWKFTQRSNRVIAQVSTAKASESQAAATTIKAPVLTKVSDYGNQNFGLYFWNQGQNSSEIRVFRDGQRIQTLSGDKGYYMDPAPAGAHIYYLQTAIGGAVSGKSRELSVGTVTNRSGERQPASTGPSIEGGRVDNYRLVLSEDFSENSVNGDLWNTQFLWGPNVRINKELQTYVDIQDLHKPEVEGSFSGMNPFVFKSGVLSIRAQWIPSSLRNQREYMAQDNRQNNKWTTSEYTSGVLTSHGKKDFTYGYFEIRAKVPKGKGMFPAFWLLHQNYASGGEQPEIDIMEFLGRERNVSHHTFHTDNGTKSFSGHMIHSVNLDEAFHTYGVLWEPGRISWYVDGRKARADQTERVPTEKMYILLNLAIGGDWAQSPDLATVFPANFQVDYVRVYQQ